MTTTTTMTANAANPASEKANPGAASPKPARNGAASYPPELALLPLSARRRALAGLMGASGDVAERAIYQWPLWARDNQLPPRGEWAVWLLMAGRGFGKTRTGAEWVRRQAESGRAGRIALVARTPADVRDVMIEGDSGLLSVCPPWNRPKYEPSKRRLTWGNGAFALAFSGHEPDQLRGPQFDAAWCDELASWQYPRQTWDNLMFGLRLGRNPQCVVTTTPKPIEILRELLEREDVRVTRGSTYENSAFLAAGFLDQIERRYEGSRTGRQEIFAEMLDEAEGALWRRDWIESARTRTAPDLRRIVVAIDPAVTSNANSDETGIIAAGRDERGHAHVLADASGRMSPDGWARRAIALYRERRADRIIAEVNNGGDLARHTLKIAADGAPVPFKQVFASRGKYARAEPVAALYEQGKVHHVGAFPQLEDQMCAWEPGSDVSPDRADALVWAITELLITGSRLKLWV